VNEVRTGDRSYYGANLDRRINRKMPLPPKRHIPLSVALAVVIIMSSAITVLSIQSQSPDTISHALGKTTITGFALVDQHKDTNMACNAGGTCVPAPPDPPHVPNDVKARPAPGDTTYGTGDDCPHCAAYCAPASIAMIATYREITAPNTQQDDIYDHGKKTLPEVKADGAISTHGVGMTDGTTGSPWEVQDAFNWSIGVHVQHNQGDGSAMTAAQLQQYISTGHPVLWLDHGGWPKNLSTVAFPLSYRIEQGHAKVITGYDDNDSVGDTTDDVCLIYDPWPEYNDKGILPSNATKGPGDTFDPYWLPLKDVNLTDVTDKYLVDTFANIPEFSSIIVPILGIVMIAIVATRKGASKRNDGSSGKKGE